MRFDDSDMKIISDSVKKHFSSDENSNNSVYIELEKHKNNGNIAKANELGENIALLIFDDFNMQKLNVHEDILVIFSCVFALENAIKVPVIFKTARSVIYNKAEKNHPNLFDEIQNSGAFSMYSLKSKGNNQNNIAEDIGVVYASFCGDKNSPKLIRHGAELFTNYVAKTNSLINSFKFKEEDN